MGNSVTGGSLEKRTLEYYDLLPRVVRNAVANARFDWALLPWLVRYEAGRITARDLAAHVARYDAEKAAKERRAIWGASYPRLRGELPAPRRSKQRQQRGKTNGNR